MDDRTSEIYEKLKQEIHTIHVKWILYKQIFSPIAENIELLNRHGSNIFHMLQTQTINEIILNFSKLTDRQKQGNFENLCLSQLTVYASDNTEIDIAQGLKLRFTYLKGACKNFRTARNKLVAHADLSHSLGVAKEPCPGISFEDIEGALNFLRDYINYFEFHYVGTKTVYNMPTISLASDGNKLLKALKNADNFEKLNV